MAYSYIGNIELTVKAAHALSLMDVKTISKPYSIGGGLAADQWEKSVNDRVSIDFDALKAKPNFNKTLAQSFVMQTGKLSFTADDSYHPAAILSKWHWVIMIRGKTFDLAGAGVNAINGETFADGFGDANRAITDAVGARERAVARCSLLNHGFDVYRNNKNTANFEGTYTPSEIAGAILKLPENTAILSQSIVISRGLADKVAQIAMEKHFSDIGYTPHETKPKTNEQPGLWFGGGPHPYADAPFSVQFQHPGSFEEVIELPLYYDSGTQKYIVTEQLLDDEGLALAATMADEATTLQNAAVKRASGEKAVVPAESAVNPDDYKNPLAKQQAVDWRLAYRTEATKVNNSPVKDIVTPYLEEQGKSEAEILAEKKRLQQKHAPGSAGWKSIWDTLKGAGSKVGDYMSQWSPTDYVGAYAGYKATRTITKFPWLAAAVVAVGIYAVLK